MTDTYYKSPEVSNSDLTELKQYFEPEFTSFDKEIAFKFGNLFDYMCTEPNKVNYFKRTIEGYPTPFELESWEAAQHMKKSLDKDEFWKQIKPLASFQEIFKGWVDFDYNGIRFSLNMRCKYDFFAYVLKWGGDLKSTASTNLRQFTDACYHFDYDRSRVLYMLLSNSQKDMIVGVSKKNYKVFKIPIVRGDAMWVSGMQKLEDLAFKWYILYENF